MTRYAVAAGHDLTADTAAEVLAAGGTAVDAAIAGALAAMVAEPVLAGLLGGGFLMVRTPDGHAHLLDFFVQTPGRALPEADQDFREITARFGTATQQFHIGAGTIAVPGVAPGLAEAHSRFGRMPLPDLAAPACSAARAGVEINDFQAYLGEVVAEILRAGPEVEQLFCRDGAPLSAGAVWRNPDMAEVIETFAYEGARFVTEGEVAAALLNLAREGGQLTAKDLKDYAPEWRTPLTQTRGNARIRMNPPPALGGALIAFSLQMLDHDPGPCETLWAFQETSAARLQTSLDQEPLDGAARLLDPTLIEHYRHQIAGRSAATRGTTHISVVDGEGMGAALTLSNGEGCGLIALGTGIMPNNMLGESDLMPDGFHSWTPGQRLSSMMTPMAVDWPYGRLMMLGSGGSNRIRTALTQVLTGVLDRREDLEAAIAAPRLHVEPGEPLSVDFEDLGSEERREAILSLHPEARAWPEPSMFFGGVHAAEREAGGAAHGTGDPRRAGVARTG